MQKSLLTPVLVVAALAAHAQNITVTGRVLSASGEAQPGATVLERGTSNGTATGANGEYSLTVSPQSPHSQRPPYRERTPAAYAGVHSSLSPQHAQTSHSSTSAAATMAGATSCPAAAADMREKPKEFCKNEAAWWAEGEGDQNCSASLKL